jgi:hypothetical protein
MPCKVIRRVRVEEVLPAFINSTRTDTKFEANVCNDRGISWEAATVRIGAVLHEVGHLLDCPIKSPES